jgi:adenylate kinase
MADLIVLMGPTGAGKSSQGELLAQHLHGVHLSSGAILRADPAIAPLLVSGELILAAEVERAVGEALAQVGADVAVVLDGFPRTMSNVYWLEAYVATSQRQLKRVVYLDLDLETSIVRLGLRGRADDGAGAVNQKWLEFNAKTQPVVGFYEERGLLRHVDGRGTMADVAALVRLAVQ